MLRIDGGVKRQRADHPISSSTRGAISYAINVQDRHALGEISNNQFINKVAESLHVNSQTARRIAERGVKRASEDNTHQSCFSGQNLAPYAKEGRPKVLTKEQKKILWRKATSSYEWRHVSWVNVAKVSILLYSSLSAWLIPSLLSRNATFRPHLSLLQRPFMREDLDVIIHDTSHFSIRRWRMTA